MPATYSEATEKKTLREFNREIPMAAYCIPTNKPSFSDQLRSGIFSFLDSKIPMLTDLFYESAIQSYEAPTIDTISSVMLACKMIKTANYGLKSYAPLEEGGVVIDLTYKHDNYLILEFYNSGEAVVYFEIPGQTPSAFDLSHSDAILKLSELLS